jgi:hypothetical protein
MAHVLADRVKETSTTTGTGTYTLLGAVTGYQSFAAIGNTNTTFYTATDGTNWEVGVGTYTLSGTTLARTTILASSNGGAAVNWAAGTRTIFCGQPAGYALPIIDPNADRLLFWDDSAGLYQALTPGANLTITGTTIDAANGMTLLGTITTTSGTSQALTALTVTGYKALFLDVKGVGLSNTATLNLALGSGATSYGAAAAISASTGANNRFVDGGIWVYGINQTTQKQIAEGVLLANTTAASTTAAVPTGTAAVVTAARFSVSTGALNAGSIDVYGVP